MDALNERRSVQLKLGQTIVQSTITYLDCGWLLLMCEAAL